MLFKSRLVKLKRHTVIIKRSEATPPAHLTVASSSFPRREEEILVGRLELLWFQFRTLELSLYSEDGNDRFASIVYDITSTPLPLRLLKLTL